MALVGAASLMGVACRSAGPPIPKWTSTVLDYGQGQLRLGIRPRSMASLDDLGATIRTPEGGTATVRVFVCARSRHAVQTLVRKKLRQRLVRGQFFQDQQTFGWRWMSAEGIDGEKISSAAAFHGPLLIAVSSGNLPLEEVVELTRRVRLQPPLPLIRGCFPLCDTAGRQCTRETEGEEGHALTGDE